MKDHVRVDHEGHKYKCQTCDKEYSHKRNLKAHEKTHLGIARLSCNYEDCYYTCNSSGKMRAHVAVRHEGKKLECKKCNTVFVNFDGYEKHVCGGREKKVKCPLCDLMFVDKDGVRRHMQFHTKKWVCPKCNHPMASKQNLDYHIAWHEGRDLRREELRERMQKK